MRVLLVIGTRPEAIKLAPVISALRACSWAETIVVASGQHKELLHQALGAFGLQPDVDLDVMHPNQSLAELSARVLRAVGEMLSRYRPALMLVQGDTTSVVSSSLAAFYAGVPVAHVEAGLRTGDIRRPFPEEANRRLTTVLATLHFAPTEASRARLLAEGVPPNHIAVTGNTVVDALVWFRKRLDDRDPAPLGERRQILLTSHRREAWGPDLRNICTAVRQIVERFDDVEILYPVHPNPNVRGPVVKMLGAVPRVTLLPPLDYPAFVKALSVSTLVLTDSGGVQEEAPSLGKPVLVLRNVTERLEACQAGTARLIGTDSDAIVRETSRLLRDPLAYASMVAAENPFGDGNASSRIVRAVERWAGGTGEGPLLAPSEEFRPRSHPPLHSGAA